MKHTFAEVDAYISNLFANEDDVLQSIEPSLVAAKSPTPFIGITPAQGKFLQLLAIINNAKRILEVGTLGGYSTIWLARSLPEDGKMVTIEFEPIHAGVAQSHLERAGLTDKVTVKTGKALDVLQEMKDAGTEPFDLVFIDADKLPYTEYFELALSMSRKGTIIIADNVIREGKVLDIDNEEPAVKGVQRFNEILASNDAVHATILQTVGLKSWDGMAIAVVK